MSVVDDVRKLLQDMVTPDLRALSVKVESLDKNIDAVEKSLDKKIDAVERHLTDKIDATEKRLLESIGNVRGETKAGVEYIVSQLRLDQRLTALEEDKQRKQLGDQQ